MKQSLSVEKNVNEVLFNGIYTVYSNKNNNYVISMKYLYMYNWLSGKYPQKIWRCSLATSVELVDMKYILLLSEGGKSQFNSSDLL